ncbi:Sensory box histidine kinase [hydrothermal vent metagenome]|uniref:histidine kinase n=1 Tax=hydrothermal vent metagenome TaxID=652676 RepID=A0A3B0Z9E7_9ZZZZ
MGNYISKNRLRLILGVFFIALVFPTVILVKQAFSQMKWESFRQYQVQAEELALRIDKQFNQLIKNEEARSFTEYSFLNIAGDVKANFLQRSPLAEFPKKNKIPGLIGYFQVDDRGEFSSPLLPPEIPQSYGISNDEYSLRLDVKNQIQHILSSNKLVTERQLSLKSNINKKKEIIISTREKEKKSAEKIVNNLFSQEAFDRLESSKIHSSVKRSALKGSLGRVEELQLKAPMAKTEMLAETTIMSTFNNEKGDIRKQRLSKELTFFPEPIVDNDAVSSVQVASLQEPIRITTFESEIDPFSFSLLDSGHFVLYRKVWRNGQRYTQGVLFNQQDFLQGIIEIAFKNTALSDMSNLVIAYEGNVFSVFSGRDYRSSYSSITELRGELLYQTPLSAPLSAMQLIFSITHLPLGAGANVIIWTTFVIGLVLLSGIFFIYRLGIKQITLVQQQQNFVSSVSHELKTPLTSIRMYGEILREGWAAEEKKKIYYDYIYDESERLSRLIDNVLQLARMTRNELQLNIKSITVGELMDIIRSKISSQLERSDFELTLDFSNVNEKVLLNIDRDAFIQVFINLIDNSVKFSRQAEIKKIDIVCKKNIKNSIKFTVRDYGPGIAKNKMKKIFTLFYRSENELTRETVGTGIGLALVNQLMVNMNGKVGVVNRNPGAEFSLIFKEKLI